MYTFVTNKFSKYSHIRSIIYCILCAYKIRYKYAICTYIIVTCQYRVPVLYDTLIAILFLMNRDQLTKNKNNLV